MSMEETAPVSTGDANGDVNPLSSVSNKLDDSTANGVAEENTKPNPTSNDGTSQEDATEQSLGISTYMVPGDGFSAVVKGRYSDFLVHEVDLDGNTVKLTNRELPSSSSNANEKQGSNDNNGDNKAAAVKADEENIPEASVTDTATARDDSSWTVQQKDLEAMIKDPDISSQVMKLLKDHNEGTECSEKFIILPTLEKPQRKAVHEWVRNSLKCARADTMDGKIRIWHVKFEKEMPNYNKFGNNNNKRGSRGGRDHGGNNSKKQRSAWPENRPNFLQFVLYKENIDTTTATKELSRRGSKARIGYAGMKDKRGITSQLCTLFKTEPEQILNSKRQGGGCGNTKQRGHALVEIGNFQFVDKEIRLGSLRGNRFDIALRNVTLTSTPTASKEDTRAIMEVAAKAMKDNGFINYFGTQRFGKYKSTHKTGIAVLQGNYQKAIDIILEPKPDDRHDTKEARELWKNRFIDSKLSDSEKSKIEIDCAKRNMKHLNRFMTAENSILQSLSRKPLDYKRAFTHIPKTLRMMFLHAVQSLIWNRTVSYRLSKMDKSKVLVGDLVMITTSEGSNDIKTSPSWSPDNIKVVTEEDLDKYTVEDIVLPLVGVKSKLPTNESGTAMKQIMDDLGICMDMYKKIQDKDLNIGGDYRKIIIRPKDFDFQIMEYYDPVQPLLRTDLMELNGEDIEITPPKKTVDDDNKEVEETLKYAMIVGFTLPSSAYATVALRELLKRPTSTDYQKDLKLG